MLLPDFYHITQFQPSGNKLSAVIRLNPEHEIYSGHFPEQAVVPGVVQLQIIKELLEQAVAKDLFLGEVTMAKYLRMITPAENPELKIDIEWSVDETGIYQINSTISKNNTVFTKLRAKLYESGRHE